MTLDTFEPTKIPYWSSVEVGQAYTAKLMEFGSANINWVFKFAGDLSAAKSPTDFANVLVDHTRQQFESLTERFDELSVLVDNTTSKEDDAAVLGLGD